MNDTNEIISLSLRNQEEARLQVASEQPSEEDQMVNLVFTGIAGADPNVSTAESGSTIATFPVDVKQQPQLPPIRIAVVAMGKQGV